MKFSHFLFSAIAVILSLSMIFSCTKPEDPQKPDPKPDPTPKEAVVIDKGVDTKPTIKQEGGEAKVSFTATENWTASVINTKADSWVSLDKTSGSAGSATITITVQGNDTPDDRSATVQIKAGKTTIDIVVSQKGKDALTTTASKNEFGPEGGELTIEVKANIDFTYSIAEGCKDWISESATKAIATTTLKFNIAENEGVEKREGTITVKSSLGEEEIKIYQSGAEPTIVISQSEYSVKAEGEIIKVEVSSNVNVDMVIPDGCDWIKEEETKAISTNTFYLNVSENTSYDSRTAKIAFKNVENGLSEEITITQEPSYGLFITTSDYAVSNSEHDITVEVKANVEYAATSEADWIQVIETKALTTSNISLKVAKNGTYDKRTGTVKVKQTNGNLEGVITITQDETLGIFVTPEEISISNAAQEVEIEVSTNVDYDIIVPEEAKGMITKVKTEGGETKALSAKKICFEISENSQYDGREAAVTFKQKGGELCGTVKITQSQTDALLVTSAKEVAVGPDGGTFVVTLKSNIEYQVSITDSWVKEVATKGLSEYSHTFEAEAIPDGTVSRETSIVVTDTEKELTETIKIIQQKTIVLDKAELTMVCGSNEQLNATVYVSDKTVKWESSDKSVATVNGDGVVSAVAIGQATITATTSDGSYKASCQVTVKDIEDCVVAYFAGGAYTSYNGVINYGSKLNFALKNAGNVAITANSLQLVDGAKKTKGNVMNLSDSAISAGEQGAWTVTIGLAGISEPIAQFVYSFNGKEHIALCNMEKSLSNKEIILIMLDKKEVGMEEGDKATIIAEKFPETATSSIVWSSSNPSVATVSNGVVSAVAKGETIITASDEGGTIKDECKVTVEKKSPIINFADAEVKAICVEKWDTSGDGELSEKEAAAVTSINDVFNKNAKITSFKELVYFTNLKEIAYHAFNQCSLLKEIVLPDGVTSIGPFAFDGCSSLTSISIPDGVTSIGEYAFYGCSSLTSISIPDGVTSIGNSAFYGCSSLTSISIPDGVTSIGEYAFNGCSSLTSISIPDGVTSIGSFAFYGCSSLTSITIPGGVTSIGEGAIYIESLVSAYVKPLTPPSITSYVFRRYNKDLIIYVPRASVDAYKAAWTDCADKIEPYDF